MIDIQQLKMQFDSQVVLAGLDLTVQPGEIIGLVGANGAGKSTLINLMLGRLTPTQGQIRILGEQPNEKRHLNQVGAMTQGDVPLARLKVIEELALVRSYYQTPLATEMLLTLANLTEHAQKLVSQLSGGQLRRLSFALAMAGNPQLLFLDEPTVGMDVGSRQQFWQQIDDLKQQGKTIILTSHYLEEIEQIATRILILKAGQFQYDGDFATLQRQFKDAQVSFTTTEPLDSFTQWSAVTSASQDGAKVTLQVSDSDQVLAQLAPLLLTKVHDIRIQASSLADIYREIMGE
ncbi:ABC transporter ATP-binding protein [Latilactobacillus sakei]|uniref:ABC transporter ATP-binding protein n=1 Tax=Latilactobacillus sakei TaxID=1599 RepID=UPI002030EB9F|nr:ABC transporter ATP-binding protein [Latilactobacillus sakei]MCM1598271.1 ABC transporter ATP-binding protein [Latilactobacillus sakei]